MTTPKVVAERVQALIESGLDLQKALETVLTEAYLSRPSVVNRVEWIQSLNNVSELRKALHSAYGKKSKAKAEDKIAKYEEEIRAANRRINELLAQALEEQDPLLGLIKVGEEGSKILHRWIRVREQTVQEQIRLLPGTMKEKKALINNQSPSTPESITAELSKYGLSDLYEERVKSGDLEVITLNRKVRLLESSK